MQTLTTDQVRDITQSGAPLVTEGGEPLIINVLDQSQYRRRHIPGSENIPLAADDFIQRVEEVAGTKQRPVIVYCASATCDASPKAAQRLEEDGFTQVYDYEGGMDAWVQAQLPVAEGN
jgi:rhodanese-related sulfurtransferase